MSQESCRNRVICLLVDADIRAINRSLLLALAAFIFGPYIQGLSRIRPSRSSFSFSVFLHSLRTLFDSALDSLIENAYGVSFFVVLSGVALTAVWYTSSPAPHLVRLGWLLGVAFRVRHLAERFTLLSVYVALIILCVSVSLEKVEGLCIKKNCGNQLARGCKNLVSRNKKAMLIFICCGEDDNYTICSQSSIDER